MVNSHNILSDKDGSKSHSLAFRFDLPDRSIVYTGDTGVSDNITKLAKGADLLLSEIMDPVEAIEQLQKNGNRIPAPVLHEVQQHFEKQHISPTNIGLMAASAGVGKLVLTHISLLRSSIPKAREKISEHYSGPIEFAEDLSVF